MTMRSMWSGTVGFGMAVIPVRLGNAAGSGDTELHRFRKSDGSRIKMLRVAAADGESVEYSDTTEGFEAGDGRVVLLEDADFERAYGPKSRDAKILAFVPAGSAPRAAHETTYYVQPGPGGDKAYALLTAVLERTGKAAVVSVMIREKESLALLYTTGDGYLVLERLHWAAQVRRPDFAAPAETLFSSTELAQAEQLVGLMTGTFNWEAFTDKGAEKLAEVIQAKLETGQSVGAPLAPAQGSGTSAAVDLMSAITASIAAKTAEKAPAPRKRPSRAKKTEGEAAA